MTDTDKALNMWRSVEKDYGAYGKEVLTSLFKKYPDTQQLFKDFKDKKLEDLDSKELSDHGATLLKKLGEIMKTGDVDQVATTHKNDFHVPFHDFELMAEVIVDVIMKKQGSMDVNSLERVLTRINEKIKRKYDELDKD